MNLGISRHVAHFNLWSIEWYREFETEDFDSKITYLIWSCRGNQWNKPFHNKNYWVEL